MPPTPTPVPLATELAAEGLAIVLIGGLVLGTATILGLIAYGLGKAITRSRAVRSADAVNTAFTRDLAAGDAGWDPEGLKARVAAVFHGVQAAKEARDPALAAGLVTAAYMDRLRRVAGHQRSIGKRRIHAAVALERVELVWVADRVGQDDDEFWALVRSSGCEYEEIEDWGRYALSAGFIGELAEAAFRAEVGHEFGPTHDRTTRQEIWKFAREEGAWVLGAVGHDLTAVDDAPAPFSEEAR